MISGRVAWLCGIAAISLELTVSWGLPAAVPGHSLLHDYISTAGATDSPAPGIFSFLGMTAALLHMVFVGHLLRKDSGRLHRAAAALFVAFFALLAIGLAFQCDPGCELLTAEAWIHFWFGLLAFLCLGVAALLVAAIYWSDETAMGRAVWGASIMLAALDIALLISDQTKFYRGLTERLVLILMMLWSILWMLRLLETDVAARKAKLQI